MVIAKHILNHPTEMNRKNGFHSERDVDEKALRMRIEKHLHTIGLNGNTPNGTPTKEQIRAIHGFQRNEAHNKIQRAIGKQKIEKLVDENFVNGSEVNPRHIRPVLTLVGSNIHDVALFRLATMLWSIPVSVGYGRRMRYLVRDAQNDKLIGVFALCDPIYNLRSRDEWIGWDPKAKMEKLAFLMSAYVVGAMPPYNQLLGGKLITSLLASNEVREDFRKRYGNSVGIISGRRKNPQLALVTITSALGRSSLYNRLRLRDGRGQEVVDLQRIGVTSGYGDFHFPQDIFYEIRQVLLKHGHSYGDGYQFGKGPNWRIRALKVGLSKIGLPPELVRHGIEREIYGLPIARNWKSLLSGKAKVPKYRSLSASRIGNLARERWIVPRSLRMPEYRNFEKEEILELLLS